jgi:hypothetical protein
MVVMWTLTMTAVSMSTVANKAQLPSTRSTPLVLILFLFPLHPSSVSLQLTSRASCLPKSSASSRGLRCSDMTRATQNIVASQAIQCTSLLLPSTASLLLLPMRDCWHSRRMLVQPVRPPRRRSVIDWTVRLCYLDKRMIE